MKRQPAKPPAAIDLDAGLAGITAMNVEQIRELWRQKRGQEPPAAFSKDLWERTLAFQLVWRDFAPRKNPDGLPNVISWH
jgi:hypothetical protein